MFVEINTSLHSMEPLRRNTSPTRKLILELRAESGSESKERVRDQKLNTGPGSDLTVEPEIKYSAGGNEE
ncbi:hypothetical protein EVAR_42098_1 [Eumeta japonica]|uniref:Uncharacterized protein n=1 Tax=Eumeta variegata TaxID=151549 RepID=A0A4C1XIN4_EUMVA|nr:hypothetical protein EVAR_42098_1 [Eumeta japonica]